MESNLTFFGRYQRAENGLNFAFSAVGSLLYLIGSIYFIPRFNMIVTGTVVFIFGSLVIFLSQMWKLYRAGCVNETNMRDTRFSFYNFVDMPGVGVDLGAGLGGLSYMIGSIYFLPSIDVSDAITTRAAIWFILGGFCFSVSGFFLFYRYFYTLNYPH